MKEDSTWHDRKMKVREKYYQTMGDETPTTPKTLGDALGRLARRAGLFATDDGPVLVSSDTSATATAPSETPSGSPESTTPADSTKSSSDSTTVWMVSPLGFLEANLTSSIVGPNGLLMEGLPSDVQASLLALATARAEPVEAVIQQIAEFFVENEDERAEGTLLDALDFYVRNYSWSPV